MRHEHRENRPLRIDDWVAWRNEHGEHRVGRIMEIEGDYATVSYALRGAQIVTVLRLRRLVRSEERDEPAAS